METKLSKYLKIALLLSFILLFAGCAHYTSKAPLGHISEKYDPYSLKLEQGLKSYVKYSELKDGTEVGIIQMKDGTSSKYWFRSHHLVDDIGGTWFSMSDGKKMYMAGWFCCEAIFPKDQFESLAELRKFIRKHHGSKP